MSAGKTAWEKDGKPERMVGSATTNSLVSLLNANKIQAHTRLTDLLLAGANALRVEVPVGVEVADGHPQVLHSDHRAIGQVWEEGGWQQV